MSESPNYSSEELAMFAAIADDPLSNAPRLGYADWLDERGDPLGEFIRVQCGIQDRDIHPGQNLFYQLSQREHHLISAFQKEWEQRLSHLPLEFGGFDRGLVGRITISPEDFASCAPELFELCPWLGTIDLTSPFEAIPSSPYWSRIKSLYIECEGELSPGWIANLIESAGFERIDGLELWDLKLNARDMGAIANSPVTRGLRSLGIWRSNLNEKLLEAAHAWTPF